MSQLTSITNLRNSSAMQVRVENVMRYLKALNSNWHADWFFPIAIIRASNGGADCSWVRSHTGTHHKTGGNVVVSGQTFEASRVIDALKNVMCADADNVTTDALAEVKKLNDALSSALGATVDWTQGITTGVEAAVAQAPFGQPAGQSTAAQASPQTPAPAAKKMVAKKSSTVKPIATKKPDPFRPTKLDDAKRLFNDLTPKQKVELAAYAEQKILASKPCLVEREKLVTAAA